MNEEVKEVLEFLSPFSPVLVGSYVKGTSIPGKKEVDIFVFCEEDKSIKEKIDEIEKALKGKGKIEKLYANTPYLRFYYKGWQFDIVAGYKLRKGERPRSPFDRTYLHTQYILEKMDEEKKKEVIKLKLFLKKHNLYGGEIRVEGISGYLAELLLLYYGSFNAFLKAVKKWNYGEVIDIEGYYPSPREVRKKFSSPLIVIDPVDKERNVAACFSEESFFKLKLLAYFYPCKICEREDDRAVSINFVFSSQAVDEIAFGQLKRVARVVRNLLERERYIYIGKKWDRKEDKLYLSLSFVPPAEYLPFFGPLLFDEENVKKFIGKHKRFFIAGKRLATLLPRKQIEWIKSHIPSLSHLQLEKFEIGKGWLYEISKDNEKI